MALHTQIRRWRKFRNLTQEELAHKCGYPGQSRIGNYERPLPSGRIPSADEIPTLAAALEITTDQLYFGAPGLPGQPPQPVRLDPEKLKAATRRLYLDFAQSNLAPELNREIDLLALAYEVEMTVDDAGVKLAYADAVAQRISARQGEIDEVRKATAGPTDAPALGAERRGRPA